MGKSFSRQIRLRQLRCRAPQHLVFHLEKPDTFLCFPQFSLFSGRYSLDLTFLHAMGTNPLTQCHLVDPETEAELNQCGALLAG